MCFSSHGVTLRAVLHQPIAEQSVPGFVICHGYFQSNRIGPIGLYVAIARALAEHGIACLRYDAAGFGESDGSYLEVSYESLCRDLTTATDVMTHHDQVDSSRIGIIGHSLGANIAADVASKNPGIAYLCMLSPNPVRSASEATLFSASQVKELTTRGFTIRKGIYASANVYEPINKGIMYDCVRNLDIPAILLFGEADQYYTASQYSHLVATIGVMPVVHAIPGADHNFLPLSCRGHVIAALLQWIAGQMKQNNREAD